MSGVPLISPHMSSWHTQGKLLFSLINNINTRLSSDLHTPTANLTTFQKGTFYFGIKVFNYLPPNIKNTSHDINSYLL
jgi:hypothetical protein